MSSLNIVKFVFEEIATDPDTNPNLANEGHLSGHSMSGSPTCDVDLACHTSGENLCLSASAAALQGLAFVFAAVGDVGGDSAAASGTAGGVGGFAAEGACLLSFTAQP